MSHHIQIAGLDIDDLTPKQLRQLLRMSAKSHLMHSKKDPKDQEEDAEKAEEENDDLVNLHREKKGDSKPPKVEEDDLPAFITKKKDKKHG